MPPKGLVRAYPKSRRTVAAHVMRVHPSAFSPRIHLRFLIFSGTR
jgi:hypothetical protein